MLLAGGSFTLYWRALRGNVKPLFRSTEFRVYLLMVGAITLWAFVTAANGEGQPTGFRDALFTVSSTVTTTGYVTTEYGLWSQTAQSLLLIALPIGAMAGSTAGGIKILRIMAVSSFAHREALKHLHPNLVRPIRVGNAMLSDVVAGKVVGFLLLALVIFGGGSFADRGHRPRPHHVVLGVGDRARQRRPRARCARSHRRLPGRSRAEGRLIAIGQMLLGRLEIYPVILAISVVTLRLPKAMLPRRMKRF